MEVDLMTSTNLIINFGDFDISEIDLYIAMYNFSRENKNAKIEINYYKDKRASIDILEEPRDIRIKNYISEFIKHTFINIDKTKYDVSKIDVKIEKVEDDKDSSLIPAAEDVQYEEENAYSLYVEKALKIIESNIIGHEVNSSKKDNFEKYNITKNLGEVTKRINNFPGIHSGLKAKLLNLKDCLINSNNIDTYDFLKRLYISTQYTSLGIEFAKIYGEMFFHTGKISNRNILQFDLSLSSFSHPGFSTSNGDFLIIVKNYTDLSKETNFVNYLKKNTKNKRYIVAFITAEIDYQKYFELFGVGIKIDISNFSYVEKRKVIKALAEEKNCRMSDIDIAELAKLQFDDFYSGINTRIDELIKDNIINGTFDVFDNQIKYEQQHKLQHENKPDDPNIEFEQLIGLKSVKEKVDQFSKHLIVQKRKLKEGMKVKPICMHMMFSGSPGVAKTTVARLIGAKFKELGILSKGNFYEIGRNELVGKYVGWTADKLKSVIHKAKGSILFIDEAYNLVTDDKDSFGLEALSTLIQEMENNRNDLVVIMAGYKNHMDELLSRNPGLKDRIAFNIDFPDYDAQELFEIFKLMIKKRDLTIDEEGLEKLKDYLNTVYNNRDDNFGNGRFIRKLVERIEMYQEQRIANDSDDDLSQIAVEDVLKAISDNDFNIYAKKTNHQKIGFGL